MVELSEWTHPVAIQGDRGGAPFFYIVRVDDLGAGAGFTEFSPVVYQDLTRSAHPMVQGTKIRSRQQVISHGDARSRSGEPAGTPM